MVILAYTRNRSDKIVQIIGTLEIMCHSNKHRVWGTLESIFS
jgi:hypothetical protein